MTVSCTGDRTEQARNGDRPNIIFLLTDDQRWDALGYAGNETIRTPEMDRLAREGTFFRNAYVTTSICAVSRACILSGQYARRHGIHNFVKDFSPEQYARIYPVLLRESGYYTGFIGKYGINNREESMPGDRFDYWRGFPGQNRYWHKDDKGNDIHLTRIMGSQALEFLDRAPENTPFCLSVSFKAPHVQDGDPNQFLYDSAYEELYEDVVMPLPETHAGHFWESCPEIFRTNQGVLNESRRRWEIRFSTHELHQHSVKGYYRLIYGVDRVIGEIREKLEEKGLSGNTVFILAGDNGFFLAEHGMAGKWYGYEESIRVPLIVYDPRLPEKYSGLIRDETVLNIDIAPTILEIAGVPLPDKMQGRSLVALCRNEDPGDWRKAFFYEHLFEHPAIPRSEGYVGERYKLLKYLFADTSYFELYDLEKDPFEIDDKTDDPAYAGILQQMKIRLDSIREASR